MVYTYRDVLIAMSEKIAASEKHIDVQCPSAVQCVVHCVVSQGANVYVMCLYINYVHRSQFYISVLSEFLGLLQWGLDFPTIGIRDILHTGETKSKEYIMIPKN